MLSRRYALGFGEILGDSSGLPPSNTEELFSFKEILNFNHFI